ncbi:MAG: response regulator [Saprospiraceae bacterium]
MQMFLDNQPRILILDSQYIIAADVFLQLSKMGFEVVGIHSCSNNLLPILESKQLDIIIMDIQMNSISRDIRNAQIITEIFKIPLVFISTHSEMEFFKTLVQLHPHAFISKPFESKDLKRGLATTLRRMTSEGRWPRQPNK